jgi:hypothetical protein
MSKETPMNYGKTYLTYKPIIDALRSLPPVNENRPTPACDTPATLAA